MSETGKLFDLLDEGDPHFEAVNKMRELLLEARTDFPREPSFLEKLAMGRDIYLVYTGKIEAWFEKWFG